MPIDLRPGTNDDEIFAAVITRNEYRLPTHLPKESVVLDVGAHAGMFSYLALQRGAGHVYAYEPEPGNYLQAKRNLTAFGSRVHLARKAVWRSDSVTSELHFFPSEDPRNKGGGTVIWETDGPLVETLALDDVVRSVVSDHHQPIAVLKLDCEGAEFPILLTSHELRDVQSIVGEYHELLARPPRHAQVDGGREFSLERLRKFLQDAGFDMKHEFQAQGPFGQRGLFFARRPGLIAGWRRRLRRQ